MIVQCDECKAKFRLDESRIGERGAKVRCSKCRHVFMVHPPQTRDEEEYDSFLDGLDGAGTAGTAPEPEPEPAAAAVEPPAPEMTPAVEEQPAPAADAGAFEFSFEAPAPAAADEPAAAADQDDAFAFDDTPFSPAAADDAAGTAGEFEFGDIHPAAAEPPADDDLFAGRAAEFDFASEAGDDTPSWEAGEARELSGFDFGGSDIAAAVGQEPEGDSGTQAESLDFASFEQPEPTVDTAGDDGPDLSAGNEPGAVFDFGDPPAVSVTDGDDGDEPQAEPFPSFALEPAADDAADPLAVDEFTFDSAPAVDDAVDVTFDNFGPDTPAPEAALFAEDKPEPAPFSFDFGDVAGGAPQQSAGSDDDWDISSPAAGDETAGRRDDAGSEALRGLASPFESALAAQDGTLDEELPPLSIATRRKSSALRPVVMTVVAAALVGGIGGGGYYLYRGGAAAFERVGLGAVAPMLGLNAADEGTISVGKVTGTYVVNREAGELFVVTGEAANGYRRPRASLQVKVSLLGKDGKPLAQKTAFCGNIISAEQLKELPWAKIEAAMSNPFGGDSLMNLGVLPGKTIPFVVVFSQVPKDVADFAVEVAGSTAAEK